MKGINRLLQENGVNFNYEQLEKFNQQRNRLLKQFPDKVFWVYKFVKEDENKVEQKLIPNALSAYEDQFILRISKWLETNPDIHILDLWRYMKWELIEFVWVMKWEEILYWIEEILKNNNYEIREAWRRDLKEQWYKVLVRKVNEEEIGIKEWKVHEEWEVCYASVWAYEMFLPSKKNDVKELYFTVTERDGGANDKWMYTIIAWRWISDKVDEETAREYIEERVVLWKDWKFYVPNFEKYWLNEEQTKEHLKQAISSFVSDKLENIKTYKDSVFEKIFWLTKNEFIDKLKNIANGKEEVEISTFEIEDITEELKDRFSDTELGKNIKEVVISWKSSWYFHVVYDERTWGYEFKKVLVNRSLDNWIIPLWQFFTESSNQRPKITTWSFVMEKKESKYVPYFVEFVRQTEEVKKDLLNMLQ